MSMVGGGMDPGVCTQPGVLWGPWAPCCGGRVLPSRESSLAAGRAPDRRREMMDSRPWRRLRGRKGIAHAVRGRLFQGPRGSSGGGVASSPGCGHLGGRRDLFLPWGHGCVSSLPRTQEE